MDRSLPCVQCEQPVVASEDVDAFSCPSCGTTYRAVRCPGCDEAMLVVGSGLQECPWCGDATRPADAMPATLRELGDPLVETVSRSAPRSDARDRRGTGVDPLRGSGMANVLTVLAVITILAGGLLLILVLSSLDKQHVSGALVFAWGAGIVLLTTVVAAMLLALAHLVERGFDLRAQLDRLNAVQRRSVGQQHRRTAEEPPPRAQG